MYTPRHEGYFIEEDFQLIAELGFDFVRIPMSYRTWTKAGDIDDPADVYKVDESRLESVDKCVMLGEKYGLHVNLNFHRAPGYCINPGEKEPLTCGTMRKQLRLLLGTGTCLLNAIKELVLKS